MEHECTKCGSSKTSLITYTKHRVVAWQSEPVHEEYFTVLCTPCGHESDPISAPKAVGFSTRLHVIGKEDE